MQAADVILADDETLEVEIGQGRLIRLERTADTVFVAEPGIADVMVKSPRLIYVFGKAVGQTTLYAVDGREEVILARSLNVTHDTARLDKALTKLLPGADIKTQSVNGALVLNGEVGTSAQANEAQRVARRFIAENEEIISRLQISGPNQINLRIKIAEVTRTVLKDFGINWDAAAAFGGFNFGLFTGEATPVRSGAPTVNSASLSGVTPNFLGRPFTINSIIDILETDGLVTVLAEPNLTAISGKTASFLGGGEVPIPVAQDSSNGAATITIEYKKFGVSLSFTPTVLSGNRISMRVRPEVSELDSTNAVTSNGFNIPALKTRRAETTIELASGQSFAIAGLMQNGVRHNLDETPGLADLPVLGALFRSDSFQRNETELVIIATPYVVQPVSGKELALPTDGLVMPSDAERIFKGDLYTPNLSGGGPGGPAGPGGQRIIGPSGFILE